jgi:hypothetical protein
MCCYAREMIVDVCEVYSLLSSHGTGSALRSSMSGCLLNCTGREPVNGAALESRFLDVACFDVIVRAVRMTPLSKGRKVPIEAAVIPSASSMEDHVPTAMALL